MPAVVRRYDRAHNKSANVGRVGLWIGKSLAHALFSQGPFCAALLMKVWLSMFWSDTNVIVW